MITSAETASVLVVEDDDAVREALADLLVDEGYAVAHARDGASALAYLADHPSPDLILLDLMMPVLDGHGFRARQQSDPRLAAIPTIVLTAGRTGALPGMGVAQWLSKPMSCDVLLDAIDRHRTRRAGAAPDHTCTLYRDEEDLLQEVADFLTPAVLAGDGVVVLARQPRGERLRAELERRARDAAVQLSPDRLVTLDAAALLDEIMTADAPCEERFLAEVRPVLEAARAATGRVRAYGELLDLLWERDQLAAAAELEVCWNRLLGSLHCPLRCAYRAPGDADEARAEALQRISSLHAAMAHPAAA